MPKRRVFVSSVIENFGSVREAARGAIIEAGADPVMVNEDFPSLSTSSRNACLDAVDSSDIYLGIIGARGGWSAPSGKLVVEEEYERAKFKRLPTLFFLQDTPRDVEAERFARRVSDYVDGSFRRRFTSLEDLHREIVRALTPHLPTEVTVTQPPQELVAAFQGAQRQTSGEPILRTVIAPERLEEVIDPVKIGLPQFRDLLFGIGHRPDVYLFDYARGKTSRLRGDTLTIEEGAEGGFRGSPTVRLALNERGMLTGDTQVERRREQGGTVTSALTITSQEIEYDLRAVLSFYAALIDSLDEYKRHLRFFYNVGLLDLGYRTLGTGSQLGVV
jgi:uncharacterized protein DUF4062